MDEKNIFKHTKVLKSPTIIKKSKKEYNYNINNYLKLRRISTKSIKDLSTADSLITILNQSKSCKNISFHNKNFLNFEETTSLDNSFIQNPEIREKTKNLSLELDDKNNTYNSNSKVNLEYLLIFNKKPKLHLNINKNLKKGLNPYIKKMIVDSVLKTHFIERTTSYLNPKINSIKYIYLKKLIDKQKLIEEIEREKFQNRSCLHGDFYKFNNKSRSISLTSKYPLINSKMYISKKYTINHDIKS